MHISEITKILNDQIIETKNISEITLGSLAYDSRKVEQNGIFVCMKGALSDGHKYISRAIDSGARLIVACDRDYFDAGSAKHSDTAFILVKDTRIALALLSASFFGNPKDKLFVIGITGTKGKTSTTFMTKAILEQYGIKTGIIGTTGIYYSDKYEYIDNSTPESYEIHRIFRAMADAGITHVVMEVSSQAIMMSRTHGIIFDIAVFTNISPDHIGENEHSSFEEYFSYKKKLFLQCKKAIINNDSDLIDQVKDVIYSENIPLVTYSSMDETSTFFGENPTFEITDCLSTSFDVRNHGRLHINTPGEFSISNALCSTAISMCCGADFETVKDSLSKVHVFGRVEPVKHEKCDFAVIIDYAHNALSLESLFNSVKNYNPKNIYTVFGCGGNRSKLRRYDMGEISGKYSTLSVLTSDNPRTESVDDIISDILVGLSKTDGKYIIIKDRKEAIFHALSIANKGDIVLIVGKGNQLYEEIGHEKIPFDERICVKEYFDNLS